MRIIDELNELIAAEVISPEIAERIRNYAQERARSSSSHRLLLIFGSLGALLIGLISKPNGDNGFIRFSSEKFSPNFE